MNFIIMIGLLLREASDRLRVRMNMYLVLSNIAVWKISRLWTGRGDSKWRFFFV